MATLNKKLSNFDFGKVPSAKDMKMGIVVADWNEQITDRLFQGAIEALNSCGCTQIIHKNVPGSFELVYGANSAQRMDFDAIIAIGCIIQGETRHFEFISNAVAQGIKDLNLNGKAPVVFCVLTDETIEQSKARSGGDKGNKGAEAAVTALRMTSL